MRPGLKPGRNALLLIGSPRGRPSRSNSRTIDSVRRSSAPYSKVEFLAIRMNTGSYWGGRVRTGTVAEDRPLDISVTYEVDPGPSYRIEEVRFDGLNASSRRWVENVAGLNRGAPVRITNATPNS